jgi:hypothetical protein
MGALSDSSSNRKGFWDAEALQISKISQVTAEAISVQRSAFRSLLCANPKNRIDNFLSI